MKKNMKKMKKLFVKVGDGKAVLMPRGWKPSAWDDAFEYPGRGKIEMRHWLVTPEDGRRSDGRPTLMAEFVYSSLGINPEEVVAEAIRYFGDRGVDTTRKQNLKLYLMREFCRTEFTEVTLDDQE